MKDEVVYVSYTGLLEPLGKSQILSYLRKLSEKYSITLLTFEKKADLDKISEYELMIKTCNDCNIDWHPMLYHKQYRVLSKIRDSLTLLWHLYRINKYKKIKLFHCRAYISTINIWFFTRMYNIPYIFDMRALWIDELVEAGSIKKNGLLDIILRKFESIILNDSSAVISLTERAVEHLINIKSNNISKDKFFVIPTCVDIERFKFDSSKFVNRAVGDLVIGSMGSILSSRFDVNIFFSILIDIQNQNVLKKIKLITLDDQIEIYKLYERAGGDVKYLEIYPSSYDDISNNICDIDIAIVTFKAGISTLGTSPTRIGEFLAQGIPVICVEDVGDSSSFIEHNKVGIKVNKTDFFKDSCNVTTILELININTKQRCREVAVEHYSVKSGSDKLDTIYNKLVLKTNEK